MDAIEALKTRRCIRTFTGKPVSKELLEEIVDCGRMAASARNRQPWEFVAVNDPETLRKLTVAPKDSGKFIAKAGSCVVVLCKGDDQFYAEGGSNAAHNMLVAARALGLGACWVQVDKKEFSDEVREIVGAPAEFKPLCIVAIGYPDGPHPEKPKRELADVLHWNKFQERL